MSARSTPAFDRRPRLRLQAGLTLVELMIALTLGLVIVAAVATLFLSSNKSNQQNELIGGVQDQARFALSTLSRDIMMAGYWGGMADGTTIIPNGTTTTAATSTTDASSVIATANDCGNTTVPAWAMTLVDVDSGTGTGNSGINFARRIEFRNQDASATPNAMWNCILNADWRSGTDIVATRRVAGQLTGTLTTSSTSGFADTTNAFYLQTNGVVGSIIRSANNPFKLDSSGPPVTAPATVWHYVPHIYYVRNFSQTRGDGIPTLCRKSLCESNYTPGSDSESGSCNAAGVTNTNAGFYSECLAEGVEDLQIVWGIDQSPSTTGSSSTPTSVSSLKYQSSSLSPITVAKYAITAQIFMRVRSSRSDIQYVDPKTYNEGDGAQFVPSTATDSSCSTESCKPMHYYRRQYSTTVTLRNPN